MPSLITPAFTAAFVSALGIGNMGGRLFWPAFSDLLVKYLDKPFMGRKLTFTCLWAGSPIALLGVLGSPYITSGPEWLPVAVFACSAGFVVGGLGGTAAARPAFVADAWGQGPASALLAKTMPTLFLAAYGGPRLIAYCRERAVADAAADLLPHVDAAKFEQAFHAPKEDLALLLQQKTVTLPALVDLCGPDVVDPTPFIYTQGLSICFLCQVAALGTNLALKAPTDTVHVATCPASVDPATDASHKPPETVDSRTGR